MRKEISEELKAQMKHKMEVATDTQIIETQEQLLSNSLEESITSISGSSPNSTASSIIVESLIRRTKEQKDLYQLVETKSSSMTEESRKRLAMSFEDIISKDSSGRMSDTSDTSKRVGASNYRDGSIRTSASDLLDGTRRITSSNYRDGSMRTGTSGLLDGTRRISSSDVRDGGRRVGSSKVSEDSKQRLEKVLNSMMAIRSYGNYDSNGGMQVPISDTRDNNVQHGSSSEDIIDLLRKAKSGI